MRTIRDNCEIAGTTRVAEKRTNGGDLLGQGSLAGISENIEIDRASRPNATTNNERQTEFIERSHDPAVQPGQVISEIRQPHAVTDENRRKPRQLRTTLSKRVGTSESRLKASTPCTLEKSVKGIKASCVAKVSGM